VAGIARKHPLVGDRVCERPILRGCVPSPESSGGVFAKGDFYLVRMIERIRARVESADHSWFTEKMRSVAADLRGDGVPNSVLLIGVDENGPLTIIEGNHRMAAAMLVSPAAVHETFRFIADCRAK